MDAEVSLAATRYSSNAAILDLAFDDLGEATKHSRISKKQVAVDDLNMCPVIPELPVAEDLARIVASSRLSPVVVTAPPGSGKTTLVPGAILDDLPGSQSVVLLQPRRMAARAAARRIAFLRNSQLGAEVGYHVRFDRKTTAQTRLVVATTGIVLRRLLDDLELTDVGAVVLDEFHERSIEMDLALGMLIRIRDTIRADLRILIMSATLDIESLASSLHSRLGACEVIRSPGKLYPVEIHYEPRKDRRSLTERVFSAVPQALRETEGHVLVFLPGVGEILRCRDELQGLAERHNFELMPLYGDLPSEQQDRVLADVSRRKLILATNIAETSLTIEGVTAVIDSGEARQLTVHPAIGLPRLELVPISRAAADQRAGRAGRTAAGHCWRLWEQAAHLARRVHEPPEILRSEFSQTLLQMIHFGERSMNDFPWIDRPPVDAVQNARQLLFALGAIDANDHLTIVGHQLVRMPTHPRLGRLLLAGAERGILEETAIAAAMLSERDPFRAAERDTTGPRDRNLSRTQSDLVDRVRAMQSFRSSRRSPIQELAIHPGAASQVLMTAERLIQSVDAKEATRPVDVEIGLRQCLLDAFPDRLARLRPGSQDRGLMVGGRGVRLDSESRVRGEPFFLCLELNDGTGDARVRMASSIEYDWLSPDRLRTVEELFFNPSRRQVEARRRTYLDDLLLEETPTAVSERAQAAELLAQHARPLLHQWLPSEDDAAGQFRLRINWLAAQCPELDFRTLDDASIEAMLPDACMGVRSLDELQKLNWLSLFQHAVGIGRLPEIERLAPQALTVPSGNRIKLRYQIECPPILAVRIQELFGMRETPRIAAGRSTVLLHLLGPNYRVQQVTSDLASFWQNTYPIVKKDLRRRYPKHAWPDDPLVAEAMGSGLKARSPRGNDSPRSE